jgi:hypothetical protein
VQVVEHPPDEALPHDVPIAHFAPWLQLPGWIGGDGSPHVKVQSKRPEDPQEQFVVQPSLFGLLVEQLIPTGQRAPSAQPLGGGGLVGHGNSRTHWPPEATYTPPTELPSGQTRARSGTGKSVQSGSVWPELPALDPLQPDPLDPDPLVEPPLVEPEVEPELDPP